MGRGRIPTSRWVGRVRRLPLLVRDAALAAVLFVFDVLVFSDIGNQNTGSSAPAAFVVAYAVVGFLPLLWRRRAPVAVFALLWVHAVVATQLPRYGPVLGLLLALYTVAAARPMPVAAVALALALVPYGFTAAEATSDLPWDQRLPAVLGLGLLFFLINAGVWSVGRWARSSRARMAELEYRRQVEAREAVTAERVRIAREMHDIVAHSVTVMVLQAGVAQRLLDTDLDRSRQALDQVGECGKQAMAELRRMLVVLRTEGGAEDDRYEAGHQPGLADLESLVEGVRRAGLSVTLTVDGEPRPLDSSVGLAAYRVAQEALTNVTKHGGPGTRAAVRLTWTADTLRLQVDDEGTGGTPAPARGLWAGLSTGLSTGHGLLGLRERVSVAGGRLDARPVAGGGFAVTATLPVTDAAPAAGPVRSPR